MRLISIRAPWHWFILHCGKDIENRDWYTPYRGPILIHASKWFDAEDIVADADDARQMERAAGHVSTASITLGEMRKLGGHIVGRAEIIDCVSESSSPWFMGRYGFVLADVKPLAEMIPFKASLGLREVPREILERIAA